VAATRTARQHSACVRGRWLEETSKRNDVCQAFRAMTGDDRHAQQLRSLTAITDVAQLVRSSLSRELPVEIRFAVAKLNLVLTCQKESERGVRAAPTVQPMLHSLQPGSESVDSSGVGLVGDSTRSTIVYNGWCAKSSALINVKSCAAEDLYTLLHGHLVLDAASKLVCDTQTRQILHTAALSTPAATIATTHLTPAHYLTFSEFENELQHVAQATAGTCNRFR